MAEVDWLDAPFTALGIAGDRQVIAGNSRGGVGLFDLRGGKKSRLAAVYRGFAGGVRDLAVHPTAPLVVSAAADRFLRLHHRDTRQLLAKIYCKTPLNAVLLRDELSLLAADGGILAPSETASGEVKKEEAEEEGDDDVWEEMATVGDRKGKRKPEVKEEEEPAKRAKKQPRKKRDRLDSPETQPKKKPRADRVGKKRRREGIELE